MRYPSITVRVSGEELEELRGRAMRAGVSLSGYVRGVLFPVQLLPGTNWIGQYQEKTKSGTTVLKATATDR